MILTNVGAPLPTKEWLADKVTQLYLEVAQLKALTLGLKRLARRHPRRFDKFFEFKCGIRTPRQSEPVEVNSPLTFPYKLY